MTTGDTDKDRPLIKLNSRQEMILVQSVLDSLAETHAGGLTQDEHARLMDVMGDVQHHLRRCVRYERDGNAEKDPTMQESSKDLPSLERAQADVIALEQQVMAKAASVRELNDQIPSMIDSIANDIDAATAGCADLRGEVLSGEVESPALQSNEIEKLKSALPDLQRSMMQHKLRVQSHLEVLHKKRSSGARRERSLLPDTEPTNAL